MGDSHEEKNYEQIVDYASSHQQLVVMIGVLIFLIWLGFLVVGFIGRGSLIKSVQKKLDGQESNFKTGIQDGKKYFWKIVSIGLLTAIFTMAAMFIFIIPIIFLFNSKSLVLGSIVFFTGVIVLIPVLFLISFSQTFGFLYAVMAELSVWDSLEKGYYLVLKNIRVSILMALLLLLINIVFAILFLTAVIFLVIPFLIIGSLLFLIFKMTGVVFVACLAGIIFLILALLTGSILKVFVQTIWVLFFKEIAKTEEKEIISVEKGEEIKNAEITSVPA